MYPKQQRGFSLVEMAFVLVIIGILVLGVLKGQSIIVNASIKKIESDYNNISAAIYSYQDRYFRLPGDDSGAARFNGVTNASGDTPAGNNNGMIEGAFDSTDDDSIESRLIWLHLRAAGLVVGAADLNAPDIRPYDQPTHIYRGIIGISTNPSVAEPSYNTNMSGLFVGYTQIPQDIALIVDARFDDSSPKQGIVQTNQVDYQQTDADKQLHKVFISLTN